MNVFIILYDDPTDKHLSGNLLFDDYYVYATRETAQNHWMQLGESRSSFIIREIEVWEDY